MFMPLAVDSSGQVSTRARMLNIAARTANDPHVSSTRSMPA